MCFHYNLRRGLWDCFRLPAAADVTCLMLSEAWFCQVQIISTIVWRLEFWELFRGYINATAQNGAGCWSQDSYLSRYPNSKDPTCPTELSPLSSRTQSNDNITPDRPWLYWGIFLPTIFLSNLVLQGLNGGRKTPQRSKRKLDWPSQSW